MKDGGTYAAWKATKTTGQFDLKTFEVRAVPVGGEGSASSGHVGHHQTIREVTGMQESHGIAQALWCVSYGGWFPGRCTFCCMVAAPLLCCLFFTTLMYEGLPKGYARGSGGRRQYVHDAWKYCVTWMLSASAPDRRLCLGQ